MGRDAVAPVSEVASAASPVLVTGAHGLLGARVTRAVRDAGRRVEPLGHDRLDIADASAVRRVVLGLRPSAVVHCAAMTDVDACERDPDRARSVNAVGAGHVARAAAEVGADVVYISTDYVFDGTKGGPYTESDATNPIQAYGRTKLEGEEQVREATPQSYIVRSAWIYGVGGKSFVSRIFDIVGAQGRVKAVSDQTGSPTYAPDLASAVLDLVSSGRYGTYHVVNAGACTFAELVRAALDAAGVESDVDEVPVSALGLAAPRPANTSLDTRAWAAAGFPALRPWTQAVREFAAAASGTRAPTAR